MATKKKFDLESIPSSCSISGSDDDDFYKKPQTVTKRAATPNSQVLTTPNSNPPNSSLSETASKTSLPFSTTPISTNSNSPKSARIRPGRSNASFASSLADTPKAVTSKSATDVTESPIPKPRKVRGGGLRKVLKKDTDADLKQESLLNDDSNPFGDPDETEKESKTESGKKFEKEPVKKPVKVPETSPRYSPKILNPKNFKSEKITEPDMSRSKPPKKKTGFNDNSLRRTAVSKSQKLDKSSKKDDANPFGEVESSEEEQFDDSNPFGEEIQQSETKNPFGEVESEEADEFDESNPFGEPTTKSDKSSVKQQKPTESTGWFYTNVTKMAKIGFSGE